MAEVSTKGYKGIGMEGLIATWYAKNAVRDMAAYRADARTVATNTPAGGTVLDLAPGPGYLAIEVAKLGGYHVVGLDVSKTFVDIARQKAREAGVQVDFQQGNASQMPFADDSFDLIVSRAAFKNFADPVGALNEMYRTLKPGGKGLIIDLNKDVSPRDIDEYVDGMHAGAVDTLFMKATFRYMLIPRAYTRESFTSLAAQSTFGGCRIDAHSIGLDVWLEKPAA
ncbi:MAG: class I SAM-dependent methyltransferase [Anaerolineae bacterium]